MLLTFNPDTIVSDFSNGKIITDVLSNERYFLDSDAFDIISKTIGTSIEMNELYIETYPREEFDSFISELIELNILQISGS